VRSPHHRPSIPASGRPGIRERDPLIAKPWSSPNKAGLVTCHFREPLQSADRSSSGTQGCESGGRRCERLKPEIPHGISWVK